MTIHERIAAFETLSIRLHDTLQEGKTSKLKQQIEQEHSYNPWFIPIFVQNAIAAIVSMLDGNKLKQWIAPYQSNMESAQKGLRIGVVMAGNIPLVGFHDFLSVLIAGHTFVGKLSSHDAHLLPIIAQMLCESEPRFAESIEFCSGKLTSIDRLIATGGDNAMGLFAHYFQQYPTIIRKHCNSIAILDGTETEEELKKLADDIFLYFGLGCRSVSKIYIPLNYDFTVLFQAMDSYKNIMNQHSNYLNNIEYQKAVHLLNSIPFFDQGISLFKEESALASPIGIIHYQYYDKIESLVSSVLSLGEKLQCIMSNAIRHPFVFRLGESQYPQLINYANGIDTMQFLATPTEDCVTPIL
jgi:hypothetical protein